MELNNIIELDKNYYMNTFGNRTPVCFEKGEGIFLTDTTGNKYADFLGGIAVNGLGHSHPALVSALKDQLGKLLHSSNLYYIENQAILAKMICDISCGDKVFFANSGAEANEGALKLARAYFKKKNMPGKYEFITLTDSFHGRTITTATATGQVKYNKLYAPLTPGFTYVPLNNIEALKKAISDHTCAIMLEPVQGESGVRLLEQAYVSEVRKICDENDILLIFDEVQTGMGRTGKMFGYMNYGVEPDIFTLAKALGGGIPIGAVVAKDEVAKGFEPGDHGTTFGGNPFACRAGIAVIETILAEKLVENAAAVGEYLMSKLRQVSDGVFLVSEIRGLGLMIGIQLTLPEAVNIKNKLFECGYLVGSIGDKVIRMLPPLILTKSDADAFVDTFSDIIKSR
jgi:acetylornithine/N-succinyldiaminopimelate aminotransferase